MSFAVIETGGKQYRVSPGSIIGIEKLENEIGDKVLFEKVLMYQVAESPVVGFPFITGVTVEAEIVGQLKGYKIRVFTYKPKKRQRRTLGHRQLITRVKINDISIPAAASKENSK